METLHLPSFAEEKEERERSGREPDGGTRPWERDRGALQERAAEVDSSRPFVLGESLPVVPAMLVKRILKGEYIDMAELLRDNVEAERRRVSGNEGSQVPRSGRRELPDFESWLQCFSSYAALVCQMYPQKARELWAYQAMMVSEHRKCGGRGWLLYDSAFRQQITSLKEVDFSKINQSLYSTTFLAYGGRRQCCTHCMLSDHPTEECALHPGRDVPVVQIQDQYSKRARRPDGSGGSSDHLRRAGRRGACYAYNDGRCSLPYCRFEHVCSLCGGNHRRTACRDKDNIRKDAGTKRRV